MKRISAALAKVGRVLVSDQTSLKRARRRYRKFRSRADHNHKAGVDFQKRADQCRAPIYKEIDGQKVLVNYPAPELAARFDRQAARCHARAYKSHLKAIWWRGQVKTLVQRIDKLETRHDKLESMARRWRRTHGVQIHGNTVTGGTPGQRFRAAVLASVANCANGRRRNFYSMSGAWDIDHVITPGETYGERSDCSSTVTGWCKAAGLPDPNGEDWRGGYTATLTGQHNGWRRVSLAEMKRVGWGYVVYGGGVGHHTEAYIGPGDRTGGHGSAPVDFGTVDLFGDGDFRCYIFDPRGD